jgi:hypothetical protein
VIPVSWQVQVILVRGNAKEFCQAGTMKISYDIPLVPSQMNNN